MTTPTLDFLIRSALEFRRGGWVFTGFHWPVLAGQLAHSLPGHPFVQVFEGGGATWGAGEDVPTSTTDYPAYGNALGWVATTADVLLAMGRRFDRVVLDAANVDITGQVNSSFIGPRERPLVRLPGGGGAPDIAAQAKELVLLHGGNDVTRIQAKVEHVTAAPGPQSVVWLHTRWGVLRLDGEPHVTELASEVAGGDDFVKHVRRLGVEVDSATARSVTTDAERHLAAELLTRAARRGYQVARRARTELNGAA